MITGPKNSCPFTPEEYTFVNIVQANRLLVELSKIIIQISKDTNSVYQGYFIFNFLNLYTVL